MSLTEVEYASLVARQGAPRWRVAFTGTQSADRGYIVGQDEAQTLERLWKHLAVGPVPVGTYVISGPGHFSQTIRFRHNHSVVVDGPAWAHFQASAGYRVQRADRVGPQRGQWVATSATDLSSVSGQPADVMAWGRDQAVEHPGASCAVGPVVRGYPSPTTVFISRDGFTVDERDLVTGAITVHHGDTSRAGFRAYLQDRIQALTGNALLLAGRPTLRAGSAQRAQAVS